MRYQTRRAFFTSATFSYLNRARVLAASMKKHHPEYERWLVIADQTPPGIRIDWIGEGFDRVVTPYELDFQDFASFVRERDVVEASTGVKGHMLRHMLHEGVDEVVYLDPDTVLYSRLEELTALFAAGKSPILTPHLLTPETAAAAIISNEIGSLKHGVFNLGFVAVSNTPAGRRFADWWATRLENHCDDRTCDGLFVDQKWCDLVPCFFPDSYLALLHPGYNVASWNLTSRHVSRDVDGTWLVNNYPLRFMHFTKAMNVGDTAYRNAVSANTEALELLTSYQERVLAATHVDIPSHWWAFST